MSAPIFTPLCPRPVLPASMLIQACQVNWSNLARIVIRDATGAVPFLGSDSATQITALETQANWTAAIAAAAPDSIVLTPKVTNAELTAGDFQTTENADQSITWTGDVALSQLAMTFNGLSSENEQKLNQIQGSGLVVMFIMKDGKTLCCNLADSTDGTNEMMIKTELMTFGGRNHATGSDPDTNIMMLYFQKEALMNWAIYDTSAFGLIL